jgi:hypothetical protein
MTRVPFAVWSHRRLLVCATFVAACATPSPTEMLCACPPARTHIVIAGRIRTAADSPVAGALVEFIAVPVSRDTLAGLSLLHDGRAITDSAGGFRTRVFSGSSPQLHALRLRVIRAAPPDTTVVSAGPVRFVAEGDRPDSTFVAVRVP